MSFYITTPSRRERAMASSISKISSNNNNNSSSYSKQRGVSSRSKIPTTNQQKKNKRLPTSSISSSSKNDQKKKKKLIPTTTLSQPKQKCSFCQSSNAAIIITGLVDKPLCLLHYYTTRYNRVDSTKVIPAGRSAATAAGRSSNNRRTENNNNRSNDGATATELKHQLPLMQDVFSEVFLELRKEIAEEAKRSFRENKEEQQQRRSEDPLAALLSGRSSSTTRKPDDKTASSRAAAAAGNKSHNETKQETLEMDKEGGFMRDLELPKRLLLHKQRQRMQAKREAEALYQMQQKKGCSNPYKRLKANTKHYWDIDGGNNSRKENESSTNDDNNASSNATDDWLSIEKSNRHTFTCTCGSANVESDVNITGRNDIAKGETWGNKDRSDVVTRCRCLTCGRNWNEED